MAVWDSEEEGEMLGVAGEAEATEVGDVLDEDDEMDEWRGVC